MSTPGTGIRRGAGGRASRFAVRVRCAVLPLVALALTSAASPSLAAGEPGSAPAPSPDGPAVPHTALESSSPAADAGATDPVEEIRLRFTTEVQPALSTIELTGSAGPVAGPEAVEEVPGSAGREIRLPLAAPLDPGRYRVSWRTAGPDGHPVRGTFEFEVIGGGEGAADAGEGADSGEGEEEAAPGSPGRQETAAPAGQAPGERLPAAAGSSEAGTDARDSGAATATIRWLFYLSIVGMLGTVGFRLLVLPQVGSRPGSETALATAVGRARTLAWIAAGVGLLALPARLWDQSVGLFGADALVAENLGALLFGTPWGAGWMLQAASLGLFLLGAAWAAPGGARRRGWLAMAVAAAGMAVVPGLQGHAWSADGRELALLNHSLHVLAVGTWLGGLGTVVLAGLPALRSLPRRGGGAEPLRGAPEPPGDEARPAKGGGAADADPGPLAGAGDRAFGGDEPAAATGPAATAAAEPAGRSRAPDDDAPPLLAAMVDGFSRVALGAVTLLVGTGLINAWIHLDEIAELASTGYGRMLLVKVGIAAGALALGFYNWRNVRPSLRDTPRAGLLRIPATLEFLIGLGVLVATALLVGRGVPT